MIVINIVTFLLCGLFVGLLGFVVGVAFTIYSIDKAQEGDNDKDN